jgi:hypothetical protein
MLCTCPIRVQQAAAVHHRALVSCCGRAPLELSSTGLSAPCRPPACACISVSTACGSLPRLYSSSSTLLSHSVVALSDQGPPAHTLASSLVLIVCIVPLTVVEPQCKAKQTPWSGGDSSKMRSVRGGVLGSRDVHRGGLEVQQPIPGGRLREW